MQTCQAHCKPSYQCDDAAQVCRLVAYNATGKHYFDNATCAAVSRRLDHQYSQQGRTTVELTDPLPAPLPARGRCAQQSRRQSHMKFVACGVVSPSKTPTCPASGWRTSARTSFLYGNRQQNPHLHPGRPNPRLRRLKPTVHATGTLTLQDLNSTPAAMRPPL